ncbi:hypothetical protein F5I97DRAFT_1903676 [Phlebopus sp. FC_14]|nr:hypothetical protein F5I97DRAFT_1903676 [Phlebopus sp. FC_14]
MSRVTRDDKYYMTLVTLQVEDCLFRVPRHTLVSQSKFFREMFLVPPPKGSEPEGTSDEHPICVQGIKKGDFKRLMKVLFASPLSWGNMQPPPVFEEWFPVIQLSKLWEFDDVHKFAIHEVPYASVQKEPAEKVALAFQYDIEPWLLPALNELAQRPEPINKDDVELLGLEVALKVAAVRESLTVAQNSDRYNPLRIVAGSRDAGRVDFSSRIKEIFKMSGLSGPMFF